MAAKQTLSTLTITTCLGLPPNVQASAQCILANPSFEIAGTGGQAITVWNQFGKRRSGQ